MGVKKEYKDYKITRGCWWRFWEVDHLEFTLSSKYQEAYKELIVERGTTTTWSMELEDWVLEDVRGQVWGLCQTYQKLVIKSKKLSVSFRTEGLLQLNRGHWTTHLDFYYDGDRVSFDVDLDVIRAKKLKSLGV